MSKQVYVDIGYHDPTSVYEIKLVKIAEISSGTSLAEIIGKLKSNGINNVIVDSAGGRETLDMMRSAGLIVQRAIIKSEVQS